MKLTLNKATNNASSAIEKHSRQGNAKYFEVVMNVLTEWQVKSSDDPNKLIYSNTIAGLDHQIKNSISESGTSKHYHVTATNTRKALKKLSDLGLIKQD